MDLNFSQLSQLLVMLGALTYHWIKTQTKLKELELRIAMLGQRLTSVEKIDDKILEKLDALSEQINSLKIDIIQKQDKE